MDEGTQATESGTESTLLGAEAQPEQSTTEQTTSQSVEQMQTPADYQPFKIPEGLGYKQEAMGEFSAAAREMGLTQEQAQKLVDMHAKNWMGAQAEFEQQMIRMREEWGQQLRKHPEYGGAKLEENLGHARRFIDKFGGVELRKALDETGVGNHPVFFAAFAQAGKLMAEDSLVTGTPGGSDGDESPQAIARRLYGGIKMD